MKQRVAVAASLHDLILPRILSALVLFLAPCILLAAPPPLRVLFIGNSLTYANDLPAMVERIARLDGRRIETRMVAQPDYSLEDHLASKETTRALVERWDWIVLQQGPSSLAESRTALRRDVKKMASLASSSKNIALLMVWPPAARAGAWDEVDLSYRLAAQDVHGLLIPAGANLRRALAADPSLPLLASDGFHPAPAGTYLVALTVYRALTNRIPPHCAELRIARSIAAKPLELTPGQLSTVIDAVR